MGRQGQGQGDDGEKEVGLGARGLVTQRVNRFNGVTAAIIGVCKV